MAALANQVQVEGAQGGQEVVRVGHDAGLGAGVGHAEAVVGRMLVVKRDGPHVVADGLHRLGGVVDQQLHSLRAEEAGTHHGSGAQCVPAVEIVWRVVLACDEALAVAFGDEQVGVHGVSLGAVVVV